MHTFAFPLLTPPQKSCNFPYLESVEEPGLICGQAQIQSVLWGDVSPHESLGGSDISGDVMMAVRASLSGFVQQALVSRSWCWARR